MGYVLQEAKLEECFQRLATLIAPVYQQAAPDSFHNQVELKNFPTCSKALV
jgi:hypothetical protein